MKKRLLALSLALIFATAGILSGCGKSGKLVVGATPAPHGEILKEAQALLKEKGFEMEIKEFTDYVQPNLALNDKNLDANFFQHKPYMDDFNEKNKAKLVSAAGIHYEPLGVYPGKVKTLDALPEGATISVPNDTTNEARALILLQTIGLIELDANAGFAATVKDITENPKKLKIKELDAAQLARSLQDVDMAVINGNYALAAGFNVETDSVAKEELGSNSAETYTNILAVREGDEGRKEIKALIEVLTSDEIKKFIEEKYKGAVVPVF